VSESRRPSSTAGSGDIRCPFFVAHSDREIVCEGMLDGCRSCLRFMNPKDKRFHQETYCEQGFRRCEMYISIRHWKWPEE
jgi:hypothetical protein